MTSRLAVVGRIAATTVSGAAIAGRSLMSMNALFILVINDFLTSRPISRVTFCSIVLVSVCYAYYSQNACL